MFPRFFLLVLLQFSASNAFAWSALATGDEVAIADAAVDRFTEQEARDVALQLCARKFQNCKIVGTYHNTCFARAQKSNLDPGEWLAQDPNLEKAKAAALSACQTQGSYPFCRITNQWCDRTPVATAADPHPVYRNPYEPTGWEPYTAAALLLPIVIIGLWIYFAVKWRKPYRNLSGIKTVGSDPLPKAAQVKAREESRKKQLDALRAAVPHGPPERMRATIQLNQFKVPRMEQRRVPHVFREDSFTNVEVGEDFKFSVDMILEMSEAERALIKEHELDDIVLENEPFYTEAGLAQLRRQDQDEVKATKGLLLEQIKKQMHEVYDADRKEQRRITRVGDLLVSPFSRLYDSPHEAKEYADKLKTKFLPEIRKLLDGYSGHKQTETLEF